MAGYVSELKIDPQFHGILIGKGGENIQKYRDKFSVQIRFPAQNSNSEEVVIQGEEENVKKCSVALRKRVQELKTRYELNEIDESNEIKIDPQFHGIIIGKDFENIQKYKDEFSVKIQFPQRNSNSEIVAILGEEENVKKCSTALKKRVQELENQYGDMMITFHNPLHGKIMAEFQSKLKIDSQFYGILIGEGGENIKKYRDKFSVQIRFPAQNSNSEEVVIRGEEENVNKCSVALRKRVRELKNRYELRVTIFNQFHGIIAGQLNDIRQETNTEIFLPDREFHSDHVVIKGLKSDVKDAAQRLQEIQASLIERQKRPGKYEKKPNKDVKGVHVQCHVIGSPQCPNDQNVLYVGSKHLPKKKNAGKNSRQSKK